MALSRRSVPKTEGHGVNGSTSVSKTESLGSNPSAPAKRSRHVMESGAKVDLQGRQG